MIDDLGDWLPVTYIVLRAEDQYLHGSGTDGAITTESMEVTGALILAALSTSISLPLSHSLLSSALVCLSSTHYWMCWIPLLQVPIVLQTNCCKLKLALLHSIRVQVSWFKRDLIVELVNEMFKLYSFGLLYNFKELGLLEFCWFKF